MARAVSRWCGSAPIQDLVAAFGGHVSSAETGLVLSFLEDFSARHWDFRRGRERSAAEEPDLPADLARLVAAAARALGMCDVGPPLSRDYTHVLMLGSVAAACLQRVYYTGQLVATAAITAGTVTGLGSYRRLREPERVVVDALDLRGLSHEVDVLVSGVRYAFGVGDPDKVVEHLRDGADLNRSWSSFDWSTSHPALQVLAAPSGEPAVRRTSTLDTLCHWARGVRLGRRDRVLLVTSGIYAPYQHCDAIRTIGLPHGCALETVGLDPAAVREPLIAQHYTAGNYLQEIRSTICSMRRLYESVACG